MKFKFKSCEQHPAAGSHTEIKAGLIELKSVCLNYQTSSTKWLKTRSRAACAARLCSWKRFQVLTSAYGWFEPSLSNFPVGASNWSTVLCSPSCGERGCSERLAASRAAGLYNTAIPPQVQTCRFGETRAGDLFCSICSRLPAFRERRYSTERILRAARSQPE